MIQTLYVALDTHTYPILIGHDALRGSEQALRDACPTGRAAIVSDTTVWALHGETLAHALTQADISFDTILLPPGEQSKSLGSLEHVCGQLARHGLHRRDCVIAFGGGVIGDIAGFAAAVYMRGVPFIQVPTTLLAQVDSSVGGKVAANLEEGKNLVGRFYQPQLVIADTALLGTLPVREYCAGMAEVVKYALIGEQELLAALTQGRADAAALVYLSCACKARIVMRDEFDEGERMMLNLGHTFAHAIETHWQYERYNHGEAVAIGLALCARAGEALGVSECGTFERVCALLDNAGLCHTLPVPAADILPHMRSDKKNNDDEITLVLLKRIGRPVVHKVAMNELVAAFVEE